MAKRTRLNVRVVILVVVMLTIILGGGIYVYISQLPEDPKVYMERVDRYMAETPPNWEEAARQMNLALRAAKGTPEEPKLQLRFANFLLERAQKDTTLSQVRREELPSVAIEMLRGLQVHHPDFVEGGQRLTELLFAPTIISARTQRKDAYKRLQDYIDRISPVIERDPQNAELFWRRGTIYKYLAASEPGRYTDSTIADLRQATALEPDNLKYWQDLVRALLQFEKPDEVRETLDQAIKANPEDPEAYLLKGGALRVLGADNAEIIAAFEQGIQVDPKNVSVLKSLADFYLDNDDLAGGKDSLRRAKQVDPDDPQVTLLEARIAFTEDDRPRGLAILEKGLERITQQAMTEGESDDEDVERNRMSTGLARALLAYNLAKEYMNDFVSQRDPKSLEKAKEFNEVLLKLSPGTPQQLAISGMISYAEGKLQKARKEMEAAREQGIYNMRMAMMMIDIYRRLGMPTEADREIQEAERLLGQRGNPALTMQLVESLVASHRYDDALRRLEPLARQMPDNATIQQYGWGIAIAAGRRNDLPPGELTPRLRELVIRRADDLMGQNKVQEGMDLLMKLLDREPTNLIVLQRVVNLLNQMNQSDRAKQVLARAIQADPDNPELQRWQKLLDAKAEDRYAIEMEFANRVDDPLMKALEKYRVARQYNRPEEAKTYLAEAETISPTDERVIAGLLQEAVQEENWEKADELIKRLRDQDSPNWQVLQARVKLLRDDVDGAIADLQAVLKQGERQDARLLLGEAYLSKGDLDDAHSIFLSAWRSNNRLVAAMKGLARVTAAQERWDEHEQWITRAHELPAGKADPYIRNVYLERVTDRENPEEAIRVREQRYKANPDDLANIWQLASLYELTQRPGKAGEMYELGFQKTGNLGWAAALARHYANTDQSAKADKIFQDLLAKVTDPVDQARVYIVWGQHLARFSETEAAAMFNKAIELAGEEAFVYTALSEFLQQKALRLRYRGENDEAVQTYAESAAALEKSLQYQDDPDVRRRLYLRYIDAEQYDKAAEGFSQMLEKDTEDIRAMIGLGRALMMKGDFLAARQHLNKAVQMAPDNADAHLSLAQLYQKQNEWQQALRALEDAIRNAPKNAGLRMELARLYISAEQYQQAADMYLKIIEESPRYKPAYEGIIRLFRRDEKQWNAALQWAQRAREAFPGDPGFLVVQAQIYRDMKQWANVVAMYRQALQIDPGNRALVRRYLQALLAAGDNAGLQAAVQQYQGDKDLAPILEAVQAALQLRGGATPDAVVPQFVEALRMAAENEGSDVLMVWAIMADSLTPQKLAEKMTDIVKADDRDWRLHRLAGETLVQLGPEYFPKAEAWYRQALARAVDKMYRMDVLTSMANLYERGRQLPQYRQAYLTKLEDTYREILDLNRYDVRACNNLAYLYADALGKPDKALELIQRGLERNPGNSNLIDTHAWALAQLGRYDEARRELEGIIKRSGDASSPDILYHMGFVKEKTGDVNAARGYYRQALDGLGNQEDHPLRERITSALQRVAATN